MNTELISREPNLAPVGSSRLLNRVSAPFHQRTVMSALE